MEERELRAMAGWTAHPPAEEEAAQKVRRLHREWKVAAAELAQIRADIRQSCPVDLDDEAYRFWSKVNIVDDDDSCWEWTASRRPVEGEEYGLYAWTDPETGEEVRRVGAHRIAFFFANGFMPKVGRHTCDNPPCSRPKHVINGTHADNMRDRHERGRYGGWTQKEQRGEANDNATLTEDVVRQARTLYMDGLTYTAIAKQLDAPVAAIGFAVRGQTWSHITNPPPVAERRLKKLTAAQVEEIRAARAAGESLKSIADRYGVTFSNISYLTRPKRDPSLPKREKRNLTDDEVRTIRAARAAGEKLQGLADRYGISRSYVSHIATRRAYGHVPD